MRILVIDKVHGILAEGLRQLGYTVDDRPEAGRKDLFGIIGEYEGLVVRTKTEIDQDVLSHAVKLRFIARAGAGLDNIDTDFCDAHGIRYFNAGEANSDAVGEHTIGILLGLLANIAKSDAEVRKGIWDREGNTGTELRGRTVGIIGYGNTGKAVAEKLKGFGVSILAYDKYLSGYTDGFAREATMEEIFAEADVLSLHIPLNEETRYLVNKVYLGTFRKRLVVLNLSRGKIVNLEDLVEEMENGKVIAAGLDVLENEDPGSMSSAQQKVFAYLTGSSRTILTPHIGGWTVESYRKISEVLLQKIKELTTDGKHV